MTSSLFLHALTDPNSDFGAKKTRAKRKARASVYKLSVHFDMKSTSYRIALIVDDKKFYVLGASKKFVTGPEPSDGTGRIRWTMCQRLGEAGIVRDVHGYRFSSVVNAESFKKSLVRYLPPSGES